MSSGKCGQYAVTTSGVGRIFRAELRCSLLILIPCSRNLRQRLCSGFQIPPPDGRCHNSRPETRSTVGSIWMFARATRSKKADRFHRWFQSSPSGSGSSPRCSRWPVRLSLTCATCSTQRKIFARISRAWSSRRDEFLERDPGNALTLPSTSGGQQLRQQVEQSVRVIDAVIGGPSPARYTCSLTRPP